MAAAAAAATALGAALLGLGRRRRVMPLLDQEDGDGGFMA
jgi:hypothetical protein